MLTSLLQSNITSSLSTLGSLITSPLKEGLLAPSSSEASPAPLPPAPMKCFICLDEFDSNDRTVSTRPFKCRQHAYCTGCVTAMFEHHIAEGSLEGLVCPIQGCRRRQVRTNIIQDLVAPEVFERYLTVSLNRALDSMSDVVYCPQCKGPVLNNTKNWYAHCANCSHCFCLGCNGKWHTGKCDVVRDEAYVQYLIQTTKRCPNCLVHIEKNGGCDHMYCSRCRTHFQWSQAPASAFAPKKTEEELKREQEAKEAQKARLEEMRVIERQRQLEQEQLRRQREREENEKRLKRLAELREHTRRCPACKAINGKKGKLNHITCKNCRTGFCFECGLQIQGTKHFSFPSKCRQHSD